MEEVHSSSTSSAGLYDHHRTRLQWPQRFKKDLQLSEEAILLARNTKTDFQTLQEMSGVCTTESRTARKVFGSF